MKLNKLIASIIIFSSIVIQACGGGNGNNDMSSTSENVNPEIFGKIFIGNRSGPWILDLKTGDYSPIPNTDWSESNPYHGLADFSAFPLSFSGSEFVETISDCYIEFGNNKDCIVFHDNNGQILGQFQLPNITFGPARLSRDSEFVGVVVKNENRSASEPFFILNVYDRNGVRQGGVNNREIEPNNFDWMSINQVVYVSGQSIYISNQVEPLLTIDISQGVPGEPAVSPDGTQIAFVIGEDTTKGVTGTIWAMNIDKTGLRQLTLADPNYNPSITKHRTPIWSPDGKWIFVTDKTSAGGNAYVIPSQAEKVRLTQTTSTVAKPVNSYFLKTIISSYSTDPIVLDNTFGIDNGSIAWLP